MRRFRIKALCPAGIKGSASQQRFDVTAWIPGSALRFAFAPPWDDEGIVACGQSLMTEIGG
jgi:hypothetical protein